MVDLVALIRRVADLQAAIPLVNAAGNPVNADAYPYFLKTQGTYPFFVNRIEGPDPIEDDSEDFEYSTYDVMMRLVVDVETAGATDGERELDLYAYIPIVKAYFASHRQLMDDTYTIELLDLMSADIRPGGTGWRIIRQSGTGAGVIGAEFTLRCQYVEFIEHLGL